MENMKRRGFIGWLIGIFTSSVAVSALSETEQDIEIPECELAKDYIIKDIAVLRLEPDDVIVIKSKDYLTPWAIESIGSSLKKEFPGHKCMVLEGELDLQIIRKIIN